MSTETTKSQEFIKPLQNESEIIATEELCLTRLQQCRDFIIKPLQTSDLLTKKQHDLIFLYYSIPTEICMSLVKELKSKPPSESIVPIYVKHLDEFERLQEYIESLPSALDQLKEVESIPAFVNWQQQLVEKLSIQKIKTLTIEDFLKLPLQRIVQYELYFGVCAYLNSKFLPFFIKGGVSSFEKI